jgi:ATP-binding cassette subfamily C protein CydD
VIAADGTAMDVREIERRTLWDQVALLPQRPVLPPGTLREVLASARPGAGEEELRAAAAAAGLDPVIAQRGWDADLGRAGQGISLGERQRLALARAMLSPAPLVVLDEPTAHLDGAAEGVVLDLIAALRAQGRTVLVIAHRSRLVEAADDVAAVEAAAMEAVA